ncbi:tRNA lysidine(34) synthetase TilS [Sulfurimonas sp.]
MLQLQNKHELQIGKNLLAFSAGGDSTALFFLLQKNNIKFDIAIVDYGIRQQSKEEIKYAKELAKRYNLLCFTYNAQNIASNFEANARKIRYDFFESIINEYKYDNLLTAHHLGDRFEWMLMQFCKGAGCAELSGMKAIDKRSNYTLHRPLLHLDKQELLSYLKKENICYFEDKSNTNSKYKRNDFRHKHTKPLLEKHLEGIRKSFEYIDKDVQSLIKEIEVKSINKLAYFKDSSDKRSNIYAIDKYLKAQGHIISANERELLHKKRSVVLGRKYIVTKVSEYIFIAPYIQNKTGAMEKKFKEKMRLLKIEPKLRAYLSTDLEAVTLLSLLLQ